MNFRKLALCTVLALLRKGLFCTLAQIGINNNSVDQQLWLQIGNRLHQLVDAIGQNVLYMKMPCECRVSHTNEGWPTYATLSICKNTTGKARSRQITSY